MKKIKIIFGVLIILSSWICASYVGGWILFIKPIITACIAFDNHALTGLIIGTTILKCLFSSAVFSVIIYLGSSIGMFLLLLSSRRRTKRKR